jgi:hypothetical protein
MLMVTFWLLAYPKVDSPSTLQVIVRHDTKYVAAMIELTLTGGNKEKAYGVTQTTPKKPEVWRTPYSEYFDNSCWSNHFSAFFVLRRGGDRIQDSNNNTHGAHVLEKSIGINHSRLVMKPGASFEATA